MWTSVGLAALGVVLLVVPSFARDDRLLGLASAAILVALWIDKGLGLIVGGLVPTPFEQVVDYAPTAIEILISTGIWAAGALLATMLFKMVIAVRRETPVTVGRSGVRTSDFSRSA
jgi:molybdopterin-containing oxidoreductase family membrane subunit